MEASLPMGRPALARHTQSREREERTGGSFHAAVKKYLTVSYPMLKKCKLVEERCSLFFVWDLQESAVRHGGRQRKPWVYTAK